MLVALMLTLIDEFERKRKKKMIKECMKLIKQTYEENLRKGRYN